jgi:hypothetical protein
MATEYQMQARSSADGRLYSWLAAAPDFVASGYITAGYPGTALDVAMTGGGIDTGSSIPDDAMTFDDGSYVVFDDGSYAVTT